MCRAYKTSMRLIALIFLCFAFPARSEDIRSAVTALMKNDSELKDVPFHEVVSAATGRKILPVNMTNAGDRTWIARISGAMDAVLHRMNATNSPVRSKRRINEVSALFEQAMKAELNALEGFECEFPKTASGARQRSGYPDLRLVDKRNGRVAYLDPKLFERATRASSLRTFYYEPKRDTNKILEDAHHLLVGFEHDGQPGAWKFSRWELIDLAHFRVRLKAEFQASNREIYRPGSVLAAGATNHVAGRP
jgi:hypothetical protein